MTVIFSMFAGTTWAHPTGWVDFADPYLWSQDANGWAYMDPTGTQYIYDFNTLQWTTLGGGGVSGIRTPTTVNGWMYFDWPYAYSQNQNTWYYFDENSGNSSFGQDSPDVGSRLWIFNFGTNQWELMNSPLPMVCCLTPARNILGIWIGNGRYYDYCFDVNQNLIPNALVNGQFTFIFTDNGNGGINLGCTVHPLNFQQLAPNEVFYIPFDLNFGIFPIVISSSRWTGEEGGFDAWSFNFTTNTMAGSVARIPNNSFLGIDSIGINGIILTK